LEFHPPPCWSHVVDKKNIKNDKNILTSLKICGSRAFSAEKKVNYSQFFG
jgi:hypothetical protein